MSDAATMPTSGLAKVFRWPLLLAFAIFLVLYLATNLPTGDAYARGHDDLAQAFAFYVVRSELAGFFFDFNATVPQLLNGLPLNALALSDLGIGPNLYLIFEPGTAYVLNEIIRRSLALAGVYLLLTRHILPSTQQMRWVAALVALSYACIPDQASRFATITMLPFLAYALLNIWSGRHGWWNWLLVVAYPFYASLYFGGFVICGYLLVVAVVAFYRRRDDRWVFAGIFFGICALFVLVEVRSIYLLFGSGFESIRGFYPFSPAAFSRFWSTFANDFFAARNANHPTEHMPAILPLVALVLAGIVVRRATGWRPRGGRGDLVTKVEILVVVLFLIILANTTVNALDNGGYFNFKYAIGFPLSLHRVDVTSPPIWRVLLALSIVWLLLSLPKKWAVLPMGILAVIVLHGVFQLPGIKGEIREALGMPWYVGFRDAIAGRDPGTPTGAYKPFTVRLSDYYLISAFDELAPDLERRLGTQGSYGVLSVDMSPTVPLYHGYTTLDGYYYDYPQDYEHVFNSFHAAEFVKDGKPLRRGHLRLYMYVSDRSKGSDGVDPDFDTCAFGDQGGRVIFSLTRFSSPARLGLEEMGPYGEVFVYVLDPPRCYAPARLEGLQK